MSLPHRKVTVKPSLMQSGLMSGVFNARAPRCPDRDVIKAAERAFEGGRIAAARDTVRRQEAADVGHARFQTFEGVLEDSYTSRGLQSDLDRMSFGRRKGLINAASEFHKIHEAADEGRAAVKEIGQNATASATESIDRIAAATDRRFDELQTKIAEGFRR